MSGHGSPTDHPIDSRALRVAVVASSWHDQVMDGLVAGAERALAAYSVGDHRVVRVPGSFELPVVAAALAGTYDAVVALGVVIRGGTPHFDYVCASATDGLTRVALDSGTPSASAAHLRHRGAGAGPRRARGIVGGQGLRGHGRGPGHRPHPAGPGEPVDA